MFESIRVSSRGKANVLVVGQFKGEKLNSETKSLDTDGSLVKASARVEANGNLGSVVEVFDSNGYHRALIVGLGDRSGFSAGSLRKAGGAAGRSLAKSKTISVEFQIMAALSSLKKADSVDAFTAGAMIGEALGMLSWSFDSLRGTATDVPSQTKLAVHSCCSKFDDGVDRGLGFAEGTNVARTLSQTPPNIATPMWIANEAKKMARKSGMKCTVFSGKKLEDERLTGHINVGKASENKPCMIRLEYTPKRGKSKKPIVLVGKTISYDSGGLSIKVGGGMVGMKRDKDGGCGVFGAMHIIANVIKPNRPVVALLVSAENSISDEAYRPDDVLTFRNGVTVEITNTDAEGRLVLADGLCWACEKENPEFIVDMATLTGGVVVALGSVFGGMWCDDADVRAKLEDAADATGESLWRMPHHPKYNAMMKSPIADILNSAPVREAHPIQGAAFLTHFVEEGVKWAHLDIAGVHASKKDTEFMCAGPTGFGARLLADLVERS
ncbi:MAG: leucyl aminopeptidase family protein [Phycisphaerales bacterium]|nr:leucyl aminopeptidase family protein [Phycisphaerales bacterium]